jgi:hypothetical protein
MKEYVVEKVLGKREMDDGKTEYYLEWKGYGAGKVK